MYTKILTKAEGFLGDVLIGTAQHQQQKITLSEPIASFMRS